MSAVVHAHYPGQGGLLAQQPERRERGDRTAVRFAPNGHLRDTTPRNYVASQREAVMCDMDISDLLTLTITHDRLGRSATTVIPP
jgi:hypothetical protein